MQERDTLRRFLFENLAIRGEVVHLNTTWQAVIERRAYPPPISRVLGEAMAAAALLSASIKFDGGILTLQLQTKSVLRLLVVHCSSNGLLRGMARWHDNDNDNAAEIAEDASFPELCAGGHLVITIDPGSGGERYQGIVDLAGDSLTEALEFYFQRSEQLPTQLHLVADQNSAAGLLLQRLPEETVDADAWNRIQHLGRTLKENELLRLDTRTLIHRLFHEETVRLFEGTPLAFRCSCSRERTEAMLISLGYTEVRSILAEEGVVEVGCQFCGMQYHFDAVDAEQLFAASVQPEVPTTRH